MTDKQQTAVKQTLIKITDDHYVIVDDSEIKEGDMSLLIVDGFAPMRLVHFEPVQEGYIGKKISHSTQPLETICCTPYGQIEKYVDCKGCDRKQLGYNKIKPLSLSKVKELIGEVDVEKKADEFCDRYFTEKGKLISVAYKSGYNQAIEDNKDRKYTEMDMKKAFYKGIDSWMQNPDAIESIIHDFRQSLQPKTEWEVTFDDQGKLKLV